MVEESFSKNAVLCTFASSDGVCTLGFIATPFARPKTLLMGNELDSTKASPLRIVLSRPRGENLFSSVLVGNEEDVLAEYETLRPLISEDLIKRIDQLRK